LFSFLQCGYGVEKGQSSRGDIDMYPGGPFEF
jgi:hypothetical protein